jgi:hypothetical protein
MLSLNKTNPSPNTSPKTALQLQTQIQTAMDTAKCRKCGCMKETLLTIQGQLTAASASGKSEGAHEMTMILRDVDQALGLMEPIEYT